MRTAVWCAAAVLWAAAAAPGAAQLAPGATTVTNAQEFLEAVRNNNVQMIEIVEHMAIAQAGYDVTSTKAILGSCAGSTRPAAFDDIPADLLRPNTCVINFSSETRGLTVSGAPLYIADIVVFGAAAGPPGLVAGGGLTARNTARVYTDSVVWLQNTADDGGGIAVLQSFLSASGGAFISNQARSRGGAFYLDQNSAAVLNTTRVCNNSASTGSLGFLGADNRLLAEVACCGGAEDTACISDIALAAGSRSTIYVPEPPGIEGFFPISPGIVDQIWSGPTDAAFLAQVEPVLTIIRGTPASAREEGESNGSDGNIPAIVGGVVGSVIFVTCLLLGVLLLKRRSYYSTAMSTTSGGKVNSATTGRSVLMARPSASLHSTAYATLPERSAAGTSGDTAGSFLPAPPVSSVERSQPSEQSRAAGGHSAETAPEEQMNNEKHEYLRELARKRTTSRTRMGRPPGMGLMDTGGASGSDDVGALLAALQERTVSMSPRQRAALLADFGAPGGAKNAGAALAAAQPEPLAAVVAMYAEPGTAPMSGARHSYVTSGGSGAAATYSDGPPPSTSAAGSAGALERTGSEHYQAARTVSGALRPLAPPGAELVERSRSSATAASMQRLERLNVALLATAAAAASPGAARGRSAHGAPPALPLSPAAAAAEPARSPVWALGGPRKPFQRPGESFGRPVTAPPAAGGAADGGGGGGGGGGSSGTELVLPSMFNDPDILGADALRDLWRREPDDAAAASSAAAAAAAAAAGRAATPEASPLPSPLRTHPVPEEDGSAAEVGPSDVLLMAPRPAAAPVAAPPAARRPLPAAATEPVPDAAATSALAAALDALTAREVPFAGQYGVLQSSERRARGCTVVQFARSQVTLEEVALKFHLPPSAAPAAAAPAAALAARAYDAERGMYERPSVQPLMPAVLAFVPAGAQALPAGLPFAFPPCVISERGLTVDEWSRGETGDAPRDFFTVWAVALSIAELLQDLHAVGVAHRGVTPTNVMLRTAERRWTLLDFHRAADIGTDAAPQYVGAYTAPETIAAFEAGAPAERVSGAADVWALGVMTFEVILACPVFVGPESDTWEALAGRGALPWEDEERLQPLRTLRESLLACLSRNPAARPTAAQLVRRWAADFQRVVPASSQLELSSLIVPGSSQRITSGAGGGGSLLSKGS